MCNNNLVEPEIKKIRMKKTFPGEQRVARCKNFNPVNTSLFEKQLCKYKLSNEM